MAGVRDCNKYFPIQNIQSVVKLFRAQFSSRDHPNLAFLSVVVGAIENALTNNRSFPSHSEKETNLEPIFPLIDLSTIEALYFKFASQIKGSIDLSEFKSGYATRELVKKVSDVIWSSLTRSFYKDKAHLQSLFSYLTGNKLDCFGVAFAVVAACQVLGYNDVHLSLSEDHAWVVFGKNAEHTAEVTWHGKGNEDKRGQPITAGVAEKSWLYLNGHPIKCTREMEAAAMVSGINPSVNATMDSVELASLQQELLWLLYDMGHLDKYPMALGNLGDLEEISPTPGRPSALSLFHQAIESGCKHYRNMHVYPYTYLGGFLYRNRKYKEALKSWAEAASVIRVYNYSREDEEIYKEFLEIANELIPHVIKMVSMQADDIPDEECAIPKKENQLNFLHDPECFAYLLQFYDGICEWEEGSSTPVLHTGWAKHLVNSISKFDAKVRSMVHIIALPEESESENTSPLNGKSESINVNGGLKNNENEAPVEHIFLKNVKRQHTSKKSKTSDENFIKTLVSRIPQDPNEAPHPNIAALAAACSENILNPEYLLGGGEPFSSNTGSPFSTTANDGKVDYREFLSSRSNGTSFPGISLDSVLKVDSLCERGAQENATSRGDGASDSSDGESAIISLLDVPRPKITLHSEKMKGLRELLLAEKLNASAIKLQLTAQSQVQVVKRPKTFGEFDFISINMRCKRTRRE